MTDYTPPVYERQICNIAPDNHPHAALQLLYVEERREITKAFYINTNVEQPRPEDLVEGKNPSFNGA